MPDWLKILISTLAGLSAGLLAEPLKERMLRSVRTNRMKQAVNSELLDFMFAAEAFIRNAPVRYDYHYFKHASMEYYRLVSSSDKGNFLQIDYANRFVELFTEAERLAKDDQSSPEATIFAATQFLRRCYLYSKLYKNMFSQGTHKYVKRKLDRPPFNERTALKHLMEY